MPDAEIIAVGSELLTPQKIDTNSLYLTDQLNALGVEVVRKTVVGDERQRLTDTILGAIARSQIVLTGGWAPPKTISPEMQRGVQHSAAHCTLRSGDLRQDQEARIRPLFGS